MAQQHPRLGGFSSSLKGQQTRPVIGEFCRAVPRPRSLDHKKPPRGLLGRKVKCLSQETALKYHSASLPADDVTAGQEQKVTSCFTSEENPNLSNMETVFRAISCLSGPREVQGHTQNLLLRSHNDNMLFRSNGEQTRIGPDKLRITGTLASHLQLL